jgi:hypothetical protein
MIIIERNDDTVLLFLNVIINKMKVFLPHSDA